MGLNGLFFKTFTKLTKTFYYGLISTEYTVVMCMVSNYIKMEVGLQWYVLLLIAWQWMKRFENMFCELFIVIIDKM